MALFMLRNYDMPASDNAGKSVANPEVAERSPIFYISQDLREPQTVFTI
jgi:hypothetical protein